MICVTSPQSSLRRARRKVPIGYNEIITPSNTLVPRPIPLTTANGIRIIPAVLPQYTFWTRTQTDGQSDKSVPTPAYALLIVWRRG